MPRVRETYMSDYCLTKKDIRRLMEYCKAVGIQQQDIILKAAQITNESIAVPLFINLTTGMGYDKISQCYEIPMKRDDFQGYRRKALSVLHDLIRAHQG